MSSSDTDNGVQVTSAVAVDPKVVDMNLFSEAMMRIIAGFGQLLQICHAADATDSDKEYAIRMMKIMMARIEYEFVPMMKETMGATKH